MSNGRTCPPIGPGDNSPLKYSQNCPTVRNGIKERFQKGENTIKLEPNLQPNHNNYFINHQTIKSLKEGFDLLQ